MIFGRRMSKFFLVMLLFSAAPVFAHVPVVSSLPPNPDTILNKYLNVGAAQVIPDPSVSSQAIYDALLTPGDVRVYSFTAEKNAILPVEVLVPVRHSNVNFRPSVAVIYWVGGVGSETTVPFKLPNNYGAIVATAPTETREVLFEPYSVERLYHGTEIKISVEEGKRYYIAVYDPKLQTGDYALAIGKIENFSRASAFELAKNIVKVKLDLVGGRFVPWRDLSGLLLMLLGLIIGFGAVLVVGGLCFLSRRGIHYAETIIRIQTIAEPLVWLGLFLSICGGILFFWQIGFGGIPALLSLIAVILLMNSDFTYNHVYREFVKYEREGRVSRKLPVGLRMKVIVSSVIFFIGWSCALLLLVWYLLL